ncbi:glycosyltransferase family 2 protein [Alteribacter natronophilus]|uniref:glycosyltransferase family 2 protein n=1 Tax=Alteribacter natronophilus TaxID=2583810 RepID=UPI00110F610B|nr:glycosyltransferase family 2 protein [Alteribacter natronophilus]TMW70540.1 glycosyltransferase family 2 protein [Alteribacter natronophilus]
MRLISVIVPVYNVDQYLGACIESIRKQTYPNLEILLINDGSTDDSGTICDNYSLKDCRIKVTHKKNEGVSSARNTGIKQAKGDYIAFIDPDDEVHPEMYEKLCDAAENHNADITVCPIKTINLVLNTTSVSKTMDEYKCLNEEQIKNRLLPSLLEGKTYSFISSVNKLYKRSIFNKNNIYFNTDKTHSEDAHLNFALIEVVKKIAFIDFPYYLYYRRQRGSLTEVFRPDLFDYITDNKRMMLQLCEKYNLTKHHAIVKNHFTNVTLSYMQEVICSAIPTDNEKKAIINTIINSKEFKHDLNHYHAPSFYYRYLKLLILLKRVSFFRLSVSSKVYLQDRLRRSQKSLQEV